MGWKPVSRDKVGPDVTLGVEVQVWLPLRRLWDPNCVSYLR